MINVKVFKTSHSIGFNISGHAKYDEHGQDIVCASVSILSYTTYRSLIELLKLEDSIEEVVNDGFMSVKCSIRNEEIDLLFDSFIVGIKSLEEEYGNFVKLTIEGGKRC